MMDSAGLPPANHLEQYHLSGWFAGVVVSATLTSFPIKLQTIGPFGSNNPKNGIKLF